MRPLQTKKIAANERTEITNVSLVVAWVANDPALSKCPKGYLFSKKNSQLRNSCLRSLFITSELNEIAKSPPFFSSTGAIEKKIAQSRIEIDGCVAQTKH